MSLSKDKKIAKALIKKAEALLDEMPKLPKNWRGCSEYTRLVDQLELFIAMCECVGEE